MDKGDLLKYPSLFQLTAINQTTLDVESTAIKTHEWDGDEKFKELMEKITKMKFKYIELPENIGNYCSKITQDLMDSDYDPDVKVGIALTGDKIRYILESERGLNWKTLDPNIKVKILYLEPIIEKGITFQNAKTLSLLVERQLDALSYRKKALLTIASEFGLNDLFENQENIQYIEDPEVKAKKALKPTTVSKAKTPKMKR